jgi:hypothetical protein
VDSLVQKSSIAYDVVLTNPPFGKKSSITVINEEGEESKEAISYVSDDFWATTSNKQLNFLQHVKSCLKIQGRAAIVVPDNVLFEGGAGETIRRELPKQCDSPHTVAPADRNLLRPECKSKRFFRSKAGERESVDKDAVDFTISAQTNTSL